MKPWMRFGLSLALVAGVAACSDDPTGPDFDSTFDGEQAFYAAIGMVSIAEQGMETMHWSGTNLEPDLAPAMFAFGARARHPIRASRFPRPEAGAPISAYLSALQAAAPGCSVSGHGADGDPWNPYDGNENNVPDDYLVTLACVETDSVGEGVTVKYENHIEYSVKERTDVLFGWDAALKQSWSQKWSDGSDHDTESQDFREKLEVTHERAQYTQQGSWHQEGMDGEVPYEDGQGGDLTMVFTAGEIPINLNMLYPPGTATLTGRLYMTSLEGPNLDWHIKTDRPLGWDPECADFSGQPFTSGRIVASLNGDYSKAVEVTALGCENGWDFAAYGGEDGGGIPTTRRPGAFSKSWR